MSLPLATPPLAAPLPAEIPFPDIPPGFDVGPLTIHWYGVMYAVGIMVGWWLGVRRARRPGSGWTADEVGDLILWATVGIVLGGRLGYVLFYGLDKAVENPLWIVRLDEGGMSFHGGLLGVLAACWLFGRRTGRGFWRVTDFIAPLVPLGLFFGRIGNFINGELWGKPTDLPWAMVFPTADDRPRHPTMLYEALLEGLVLFAVLWVFSRGRRPVRAVSGLFLLLYGSFRFAVEFLRIPDAQLGYLALDWVTMGQILSTPMILLGALLLWLAYRTPQSRADRTGTDVEDELPAATEPTTEPTNDATD